jgi:hypothetical protein
MLSVPFLHDGARRAGALRVKCPEEEALNELERQQQPSKKAHDSRNEDCQIRHWYPLSLPVSKVWPCHIDQMIMNSKHISQTLHKVQPCHNAGTTMSKKYIFLAVRTCSNA